MWCSKLKLKHQCPRCVVPKNKNKTLSQMWCSKLKLKHQCPRCVVPKNKNKTLSQIRCDVRLPVSSYHDSRGGDKPPTIPPSPTNDANKTRDKVSLKKGGNLFFFNIFFRKDSRNWTTHSSDAASLRRVTRNRARILSRRARARDGRGLDSYFWVSLTRRRCPERVPGS